MPIISVCLIAKAGNCYDFLYTQNWTDVELVISTKYLEKNQIEHGLYSNPTFESLKIVDETCNSIENSILKFCDGEYIIWLQSEENWDSDFLSQLKDFIFENKQISSVLYITGFVKSGKQITPSVDVYKSTGKVFSLSKIFIFPHYLIPSVKFIWRNQIVQEFRLVFDPTLENHLFREAIFNLDYLTTLYQENAYTEHKYTTSTLSFYNPVDNKNLDHFLKLYREKIVDKRSIFVKNPWSKVFWQYLKAEKFIKKQIG
jgi:hypothetical protein